VTGTSNDNTADLEKLLQGRPDHVQQSIQKLRELVRSVAPTLDESVSLSNPNLIAYGASQKMRDLLFVIVPHTNHTNPQFANGATIPDPEGLLEGTGKNIRHVKIHRPEEIEQPAVKSLVMEQLAARGFEAPGS
jgi:hypothetical protein